MKKFLFKFLIVTIFIGLILVFFNLTTEASSSNYYITVNCGSNVVTIYTKDTNGNYTIPYKSMICSTGTATPKSGTYSLNYKYRWLALYGGVYGQYCTRITGNILFHSVPYLRNGDTSSLEYWEYDKLGTSASAGCVRLTVEDAKWIYENCNSGTNVTFLNNSDTGPLGKPTAMKIASNENRNWDPTDPDSNNPWKNILSVTFNYVYYANTYSDLKAAFGYDESLLKRHWLSYGIKEGRQASPVINLKYYVENNSDLKVAFGDDYESAYYHYLNCGYNEDRRTSSDYYVTFYKYFHSDLTYMTNLEASIHYITHGINEGRLGSISKDMELAVFDSTYYANKYSDLKAVFGYDELLLKQHWYRYGLKEGRQASPAFNVTEYMNYNSDLVRVFGSTNYSEGLAHFIRYGVHENRKTSSQFNIKIYKKYTDLTKAFGNDDVQYYKHYNTLGVKEGRAAI